MSSQPISAYDQLKAIAEELCRRDPTLYLAIAMSHAMEDNPKLYDRYVAEQSEPEETDSAQTMPLSELRVLEKLQALGYEILKAGWPDFLAIKKGRGRFIEVKRPNEKLRPSQIAMHEALRLLGIEVEVIRDPDELEE